MARRYEYIIHGPPLPVEPQKPLPRKTLSTKKDHHRTSNLRTLYRNSASPPQRNEPQEIPKESRLSSPTTPKLPPTPPNAEDEDNKLGNEPEEVHPPEVDRLRSFPVTPVNGNSPPTPDNTPPRDYLKVLKRPYLALRPSMASTRAESFRTAREQVYSEDESEHLSPVLTSVLTPPIVPHELPTLNGISEVNGSYNPMRNPVIQSVNEASENRLLLTSSPPLMDEKRLSDNTVIRDKDTPETQFKFDHVEEKPEPPRMVSLEQDQNLELQANVEASSQIIPSIHEQVTTSVSPSLQREKSLRDRLEENHQLQNSASTEAFANVIGWNDGIVPNRTEESVTNRWSDPANPSAIEAYVVESPVKPRKRGTLRKVVKNDSLRCASSPIPQSNRTSLQSTSDSPHRLVHKKQKLNNQHRWSTGSDISKRSLSWGSSPAWAKQDITKVASIPERSISVHTSTSNSRRQSRSISTGSGHGLPSMPPVSTPGPRRKRAFSDSNDHTPTWSRPPQVPIRSSSLSAPTSRSGSRANSISSQQFSQQREQAEKDLRTTLDRMESERLSASIRRDSQQSSSPTPAAPKQKTLPDGIDSKGLLEPRLSRNHSSAAGSDMSQQRRKNSETNNAAPGSKEGTELLPPTLTGTPFSQASVMSTSPEIIEAKVVSFFPHHNESLQLIEPNRLSETPAVKALKGTDLKRANTVPESRVTISTPRTSGHIVASERITIDSPLRNPRKPPEPPQVQFTIIPPTPQVEVDHQLGPTPDTSPVKTRTGVVLRKRPSLQTRDRSESFIKSLTRNLSLRNAKNPKADQELDSILYPFWRPRAFWDDEDYRGRIEQETQKEHNTDVEHQNVPETVPDRSVVVHEPHQRAARSNTITTGPVSLIRRISERRRQKRLVDDHLAQQQALVKQTSYSSLQKFRAGRRLYGLPPLRSLSLNVGVTRLNSLRERMADARARREDEKLEQRRDKLRKSIGPAVMQSDSRFPTEGNNSNRIVIEHMGGQRVSSAEAMEQLLENARAKDLAGKRR